MKDPILDELHRTRERLLEESGGSLTALVARLERDQVKSGRELRDARRTKHCIEVADQPIPDGGSTPATR
jgi:hypothetical protein